MTKIDPQVILITGIMAAGKSSVAQALAERLPKSIHLRGDLFRRLIVNGQAPMTLELSQQAYQQLWLRYRLAAVTAALYAETVDNILLHLSQAFIRGPTSPT